MQTCPAAPCLEELLADDLLQAVMAADGVSADTIRGLFRHRRPGGPLGSARQSNKLLTELSSEMRCIASARIGAMVN